VFVYLLEQIHRRQLNLPHGNVHLFGERILRMNGRPVILADGKKKGKEGKTMPARKSLHQESKSTTRPVFLWAIPIRRFRRLSLQRAQYFQLHILELVDHPFRLNLIIDSGRR